MRGRIENPRLSLTPAGGRREDAEKDGTGIDCLTAGTTDNCIDSRRRRWHIFCQIRPHSALGYRPPAPEAIRVIPRDPGYAMLRQDLGLDLTPILT